jgi:hypothetical protein
MANGRFVKNKYKILDLPAELLEDQKLSRKLFKIQPKENSQSEIQIKIHQDRIFVNCAKNKVNFILATNEKYP